MSGAAVSAAVVARVAGSRLDGVLERPRAAVAAVIVGQIVGTIGFGVLAATHNGWVWFQGGDQIYFVSDAWAIGRWILPPAEVGLGWPLLLAPITWLTGATFVQALPLVVVLNVLVLAPLATVCIYAIACRIAGRALGLWVALLWVIAPYAVIPLFVERYHERWIDQFVPQAIGLTAMADFPSTVLTLVVVLLVLRSIDARAWTEAALAGSLAAYSGFTKTPNLLIVGGVVLAYVVARRWREGIAFLVALAPLAITLSIYKQRGLGYLPAFSLDEIRVAGSVFGIELPRNHFVTVDVDHWRTQMDQLREYFWSARLAQWAPFAGLVAVARVKPAAAALLGGWLAAFLVVKGMSPRASIEANTFWRLLMPAWPAYLLLVASIPLLVPGLLRALGHRAHPTPASVFPPRPAVVGGALAVIVPFIAVSTTTKLDSADDFVLRKDGAAVFLTPVVDQLNPRIRETANGTRLVWTPVSWRADVTYRVFRSDQPGTDVGCGVSGVLRCSLLSTAIAETRGSAWLDEGPVPGAVYRVGASTDYRGIPGGDVFAVSAPVRAP